MATAPDMPTAAEVAGRAVKSIRLAAGMKLEDLARAARLYGLKWSAGKVGDFESGRVSPTLPTLYAVAAALSDITLHPVAIAELFAGEGRVRLTSATSVPLAQLRHALSGGPAVFTIGDIDGVSEDLAAAVTQGLAELKALPVKVNRGVLRQVLADYSDTDARAAKSLDLDRLPAAAYMAKLWGTTYRLERDRRASEGDNAQTRGRIARELKAELRAAKDGGT